MNIKLEDLTTMLIKNTLYSPYQLIVSSIQELMPGTISNLQVLATNDLDPCGLAYEVRSSIPFTSQI